MSAAWFAALPIEIMSDKKVPPAIRVLCAITKFDRVGKNGRGCFATQATIAQETALDIGSVKRWIKYWVDLGYLSSEKDKKDARKRVLRVVYKSRGDEASEIGRTSATNPNKDRSQNAPEIGRTTEKYDEENHKFTSRKHREKQIVLNDEANAEETAPFSLRKTGASISSREENIGGLLAQIERDFKAEPSLDNLQSWSETLIAIVERDWAIGDPNYGRASRLLELIGYREQDEEYASKNGGYHG